MSKFRSDFSKLIEKFIEYRKVTRFMERTVLRAKHQTF